jgi:hypothetical protein
MDKRTLDLIDGERKDQWRLSQVRRASQHYGRSWVVVFDDAAAAAARAPMGRTTARLLIWAMAALDPRDWRTLEQWGLAAMMGCDRTSVSRGLADLARRGIIVRQGRAARLSIWFAWRGTAAAYRKERAARRAEIEAADAWHAAHAAPPVAPLDPEFEKAAL